MLNEKHKEKLELLKQNPRKHLDAHKLKGRLKNFWGCWLEANLRFVYEIDDKNKLIIVAAVGTHKVYF